MTEKEKKEHESGLHQIFKDARFFLMKSSNFENVEISKEKGVWSTLLGNEIRINHAFRQVRNVILIFSVKESGRFSGFGRLRTGSRKDGPEVDWVPPAGLSRRALGGVFEVDWISK